MKYAFFLLCGILQSSPALAIYNGTEPAEGDPIRDVAVNISSATAVCGGTIIAARWVLTAAHCKSVHTKEVVFADGTHVAVKRFIANAQYSKDDDDSPDVALIELAKPVEGPYARLAAKKDLPRKGSSVWIAGYGFTNDGTNDDGTLRKVQLRVEDSSFNSNMVSLLEGKHGACQGDSGSAGYRLEKRQVILWGVCHGDVDKCGSGSAYANAVANGDWIRKITGIRDGAEDLSAAPSTLPAVAVASAPVAKPVPTKLCKQVVSCKKLDKEKRDDLAQAFLRDRRPSANVCLSGGFFSKYRGGIKKKGVCEIVRHSEFGRCREGKALCNPVLFCAHLPGEKDLAPECVSPDHDLTKKCDRDVKRKIKSGELEKCDPADLDPAFRDHWQEVRAGFKAQYDRWCGQDQGFQALFCDDCQILRRRLAAINSKAVKLSCRNDKLIKNVAALADPQNSAPSNR